MIRKATALGVAGFLAAIILFCTHVTARQPQTKDLAFHGTSVIKVDMQTGAWSILEETGQMTHVGRYVCEGMGQLWPNWTMTGSGILTTASGDTLAWVVSGSPLDSMVELKGLSGRFAGAVGSFKVTRTVTNIDYSPEGRYQFLTYVQSGVGTITY